MEHVDAYARHVQSLEARVAKLTRESFALDAQLARLRQAPVPAASSVLFQPFTSKPDATFLKELGERKLSTYMLSEDPVPVRAVYALPQQAEHAWLELDASAFQAALPAANSGEWACAGTLLVVNTLETFKNTDKQALLQRAGQAAQDQLAKGDLSYLSSFVCLVHADIKSHRYLYWFAFVAPQFARPVAMPSPPVLLADAMPGAFARLAALEHVPAYFFWSASSPPAQGGVLDLALWDPQHPLPGEREEVVLGFADPSGSLNPGWPLRNLLHYVANRLPAKTVVKIIAVRDRITHAMQASPSAWAGSKPSKSLLFTVQLPDKEQQQLAEEAAPRFLGWEPNEKNKMGPRLVDLSSMLDPDKLSETAANLNLRLMKWRALPAFDEALVAKQKVLLLGAGTLGCAVARGLLGWGFRHITFVDQGRVSYSNPVRQSLFVAKDCLGHGRVKAVAAAEALKDIYPAVDARGVELQIPMPGHADANVEANLSQLDALVREHDCVVLLTDTWESRWLPTVLGAAHEKMVINAALGFDSLVVMRHGGPTCGCYFCSDVVAPRDSTRNRTLDQQCTVTRPGLAPIAGALVVELLVGLVHHPLQRLAPAGAQSLLGALFHQCRLFLPQMDIAKIQGMAFAECTACSPKMVAAYRANGLGLVQNALADPSSLERVTGLAELQALASKGMLEMEEEEDGDGDDF